MNANSRRSRLAVAISTLVLAFVAPVFAAGNTAYITNVSEAASAVTIQGANFVQQNGAPLRVMLTGVATPLSIASYGDTAIVALLPAGIAAGSYSITLVKPNAGKGIDDIVDEFFFTLGSQGPQGDKGDKGDKGDTGATGSTGLKGDKGDTGAAGAAGAKGDKGDTGAAGAAGAKGDKGDTGAAGAAGAKGDKGDTGAAGAAGAKGDTGAAGAAGAKGDKGDTGAAGTAGAKGDKGDTGVTGSIGPQGPAGDTTADYDSGWFFVSNFGTPQPTRNANGEIVLNHNGGFIPSRLMLQQCGALDVAGHCATRVVISGMTGYNGPDYSVNPTSITSDAAGNSLFVGMNPSWWVWAYISAGFPRCEGGGAAFCFAGYYRVLAWK